MRMGQFLKASASALFAAALSMPLPCDAQAIPNPGLVGGVYIDTDGTVRVREADAKNELTKVKSRQRSSAAVQREEGLTFVSLPRAIEEARAHKAQGKDVPDELRYLGGLTELRYVLVDPEAKDLVIAGPAEPWDTSNRVQPVGVRTGRPVLQLDDLIVALRTAQNRRHPFIGCTIDLPDGAMQRAQEVMSRHGNRPNRDTLAAVAQAVGPQTVKVFGAAEDTRLAYVCVAADYRLKRFVLGIEPPPVAGIGHAVDNSRAASNRYWFETMYEPLRVSPDGNVYEVRGQRLQIKAGALTFDEKGATPKAMEFAKRFTAKMPEMAAALPVIADLQNLADLSLLASLIRADRLDRRAGWDVAAVLDDSAFPVAKVPAPRTAETLVNVAGGSLTAGGVNLSVGETLAPESRKTELREEAGMARNLLARLKESEPEARQAVWKQK